MEARKHSRREVLRASAAAVAAAALAACAPKVPEAAKEVVAPADRIIDITWLSHIYEPWNNALSAQGMQYMGLRPSAKIVYSYVLHADLNTKIMTSVAAGSPPTIMGVYGPWMPQLIEGGWLDAAPDDVLQDLRENFPPVMKESATFDGKVHGYVQHIGIPTPIVNLALYEVDGLTPPTSYDELVAVNQKLDKKDAAGNWEQFGTTLATSKAGSWNVIHFSAILFSHGGTFLNPDNTKAAFNSDAGLQAARVYQGLAHPEAPGDAFVLGKSAMQWNGPWAKSYYAATAPDLRYKAILPLKGPAAQVTGSYVWFWVVSTQATPEQKAEAWKFLQWLSAPEQYVAQYRNVGLLPITKKLPEELADDEWAQTFSKALGYASIYYAKHPKWEAIDVAIGEEMERFAAREVSAEQFLEAAATKVDRILASG
jgi:ABC-type glycerol-3-phosphate transport system substrate-binding protein